MMILDEAIERTKQQHQQRSADLDELRRYAQQLQKEIVRLEGGLSALQQLRQALREKEEEDASINGRSDAGEPVPTLP